MIYNEIYHTLSNPLNIFVHPLTFQSDQPDENLRTHTQLAASNAALLALKHRAIHLPDAIQKHHARASVSRRFPLERVGMKKHSVFISFQHDNCCQGLQVFQFSKEFNKRDRFWAGLVCLRTIEHISCKEPQKVHG